MIYRNSGEQVIKLHCEDAHTRDRLTWMPGKWVTYRRSGWWCWCHYKLLLNLVAFQFRM